MANQSQLLNKLDRYNGRIADLMVARNPLRDEGWFIFNDEELDQYRDTVHIHKTYQRKLVIFNKTPDLEYVQEIGGDSLELDGIDNLPYIIACTITDLPRLPKANDQFYCDNVLYTISMVKPVNRDSQSLLRCLVYPERDGDADSVLLVSVVSVLAKEDSYIVNLDSIGTPIYMSVNGADWVDYKSSVEVIPSKGSIRVKNGDGLISTASYSYDLIQGVGNATVSIMNGDVELGSFTVNQFEDSSIDISPILQTVSNTANNATITIVNGNEVLGSFKVNQDTDGLIDISPAVGTTSPGNGLITLQLGSNNNPFVCNFTVNQSEDKVLDLTSGVRQIAIDAISEMGYSDLMLKDILSGYDLTFELIDSIPLVRFKWKYPLRFDAREHIGTIAQDVEKVIPELVTTTTNGKSVDYSKFGLIAMKLVKKLKELFDNKHTDLDTRLRVVESVIKEQTKQLKIMNAEVSEITEMLSDLRSSLESIKGSILNR